MNSRHYQQYDFRRPVRPPTLRQPPTRAGVGSPHLPLVGAGPAATPGTGMLPLPDPGLVLPQEQPTEISLRICGPDGEPLAGAGVFLIGANWPAQGITANDGTVTIALATDTEQSVQSLYIRPKGGYTDRWIHRPELSATQQNLVTLTPLTKVYPGLEERQQYSWGQQAMRLDRLPPPSAPSASKSRSLVRASASTTPT
jgi:hypothetical protein